MRLFFCLLASALALVASQQQTVNYDSRSLILNGERVFTLSGSIHYQRVFPSDWLRVLSLAAEMGLNAIQTYVQWDQHEAVQGEVSFSGQNNLTEFVALAGSLGLRVHVRIGPYICGEHFNGGVPQWMRTQASCFRCSDPGWEAFSKRVLSLVVGQLTAAGQLWTQGGPVFMLQVENEYSGPDVKYLADMVAAARNLTTAVPWVLCHDLEDCAQVNSAPGAPPEGLALCTVSQPLSCPAPVACTPSCLICLPLPPPPSSFFSQDQRLLDGADLPLCGPAQSLLGGQAARL